MGRHFIVILLLFVVSTSGRQTFTHRPLQHESCAFYPHIRRLGFRSVETQFHCRWYCLKEQACTFDLYDAKTMTCSWYKGKCPTRARKVNFTMATYGSHDYIREFLSRPVHDATWGTYWPPTQWSMGIEYGHLYRYIVIAKWQANDTFML